ncbi:hypothetical protein HF1_01450 [Mycoplasma haemofelis str. Langford 1]|uniref:Uncharacterized protein n=2 Tax=Mycoplasma haemofelis TaxID=29501 RepID=F6FFZ9_MYCHI|nr:hypothetical protein [Mycoplasma haemofelis]AEG72465.1 hypothetical protein MHF_0164 [Mycoplasma haemofelis Ohio2]CBY92153.1 hypothetical protein HF1_01450 [Mycoplasma haemofelis str. Langford 1]
MICSVGVGLSCYSGILGNYDVYKTTWSKVENNTKLQRNYSSTEENDSFGIKEFKKWCSEVKSSNYSGTVYSNTRRTYGSWQTFISFK